MKKQQADSSSAAQRRVDLAADVEAFLAKGNKIQQIPDGVSAQDPQGRPQPLRPNQNGGKTAKKADG